MKGYFIKSKTCPKVFVEIYDNNHKFIDYYFMPDEEVVGYCHCLEDFGYEDKGWVEAIEDGGDILNDKTLD